MIGKMIGAMVGARVADRARGVGGPTGAVLGMVAIPLIRRLGPLGWAAVAIGGLAAKRMKKR